MPMKLLPTHQFLLLKQRLLGFWFQLERTTFPFDAKAADRCGLFRPLAPELPFRPRAPLADDFTALFRLECTCWRWLCERLFQGEPVLAARAELFALPIEAARLVAP